MQVTLRFAVADPSQVGEARRAALTMARRGGFDETRAEKTALVVTELGSNLLKHAGGGELLLLATEGELARVDVLALDSGPGTDDIAGWLQDGYSTAGSPGTGLGAVCRLSDGVDVYSQPGAGTAVLATIGRQRPSQPRRDTETLEWAGLAVAMDGESICGDAWAVRDGGSPAVVVADGLGHGPDAARAAEAAIAGFEMMPQRSPGQLLEALAAPLAPTRGAAVAVAAIDLTARQLRFAGVGNVAATIVEDVERRSLLSYDGTVGRPGQRVRELTYPWPERASLIVHSDGLRSRWSLDRYPDLLRHDPALVAGILYRDFKRGRDDVTVVVVRTARTVER